MGRIGAAADHDRGAGVSREAAGTRSTSSSSASAPPARPRRSPRTTPARRVAIVEKTSSGGGNCVHSGGFLFDVDGPRAVDHLDALCFGKTDRAVLEAYAGGLADVPEFLESLGGTAAPVDFEAFGGMLPSWPHFPGAGHVRYRQFVPAAGERPGPGSVARARRRGSRARHSGGARLARSSTSYLRRRRR